MADFSLYQVDLDTPQPNGRKGESPRAAFTKYNDFLAALGSMVDSVSSSAPSSPSPYMTWIDTSVDPAMLRRRNAANDAWVEIGPALASFGTAAYANLIDLLTKDGNLDGLTDLVQARSNLGLGSAALLDAIGSAPLYGRDSVVGTVSQNAGVPAGAVIQRGFNATLGGFARWADGTQMCWIRRTEANETNSNVVAAGSLFFKMVRNWGFPAAFSSIPGVKVSCPRTSGSPIRMIGQEGEISSSQCEIGFLITSNTSGLSVIYDCFAVGRWYD